MITPLGLGFYDWLLRRLPCRDRLYRELVDSPVILRCVHARLVRRSHLSRSCRCRRGHGLWRSRVITNEITPTIKQFARSHWRALAIPTMINWLILGTMILSNWLHPVVLEP